MYTKKTNNTNKLIQISYHSAIIKIQNIKKKKKKFCTGRRVWYCPKLAGTAGTWLVWLVFFPVRNRGVICTGLLAGTVYSGRISRYGTELTPLKPSDNSQILYLVHSVVAHFFKRSMSKMVCQQNLVPITHQVMCPICYNS